jgi:hypothetical protein
MIRIVLPTLLLGLAAPASAQEPTVPDAPFPALATLEHPTDHSRVHAAVAPTFFGDENDVFTARIDLGGQYVAAQGFGAYGYFPVTYASGESDSETEIGDIELGGLYVLPVGPTTDLLLQGGLMLPTAADDFDALINLIGGLPRLTDLAGSTGNVTWLAVNASPMHRQGNLFLRADVGLDLPIAEEDGVDADTIIHVNVAAGVDLGTVAVAGELVNVGSLEDTDEEWLTTIALSVSGQAGGVRPFGALVLPVDHELAEDLDATLAVVAGISVPFAAK